MLDSTAPTTRRGKERETPKAKKPTYLRKVYTLMFFTLLSAGIAVFFQVIEKEKAAKKELQKAGLKIPPEYEICVLKFTFNFFSLFV